MTTADEKHEEYKTRPRSWSQLTQYEQCPQGFYLERIAQVWSRPAAWYATGLGVHAAAEAHEKGEAPDLASMLTVAQEAFRADIKERLEESPNPEYWQSSGHQYPGPEDIPRRYADLERHLTNYLQVAKTLPPVIELDGAPAVEWEMDFDLDGVRVIGYADQIRRGLVVDVKAGSKVPDNPGQLAVGAEAVRQKTGERITEGLYIMTAKPPTKTGRVSAAQRVKRDLTTIPVETLTARFHAADEGIKAGNWDPKPDSDICRRCSVASSCAFRAD